MPAKLCQSYEPDETVYLNPDELQHLLNLFSQVEGEFDLGIEISERLPLSVFGFLGMAVINGESIQGVMSLIQKFMVVKTNIVAINLKPLGEDLFIEVSAGPQVSFGHKTVLDTCLNTIYGILDFITLGRLEIKALHLPYPKFSQHKNEARFQCQVLFGQPQAGLLLSKAVATEHLKMANTVAMQEAVKLCQAELEKLPQQQTVTSKVQTILMQHVNRNVSLDEVAKRLNLTQRTLHRRLISEGHTFKEVTAQVKRQMAMRYLQSGQMAIFEVGYALGYSDPANFRRAFKRWFGQSPAEYLKK